MYSPTYTNSSIVECESVKNIIKMLIVAKKNPSVSFHISNDTWEHAHLNIMSMLSLFSSLLPSLGIIYQEALYYFCFLKEKFGAIT